LVRDCDAGLEIVKDEVFEEGRPNTDEVLPDPNTEEAGGGAVLFDPNIKLLEEVELFDTGLESNVNPLDAVPLTPGVLFPPNEYIEEEPDELGLEALVPPGAQNVKLGVDALKPEFILFEVLKPGFEVLEVLKPEFVDPNVNPEEVEVLLLVPVGPNAKGAGVVLLEGFVLPNDNTGVEGVLVEGLVLPKEKEGILELGVVDPKLRDVVLFPVVLVTPNEREGVLEFAVSEVLVSPKERTGVSPVGAGVRPNENVGTDVF